MHRLLSTVMVSLVVTAGLVAAPTSVAAATCPSPGGVAVPESSTTGDVVFRGHGWGHGLGMSQYGAQGAASLGCTYTQILTTYYRGASVATATMPTAIHLRMLDNGGRVDVTAETGAVTWQLVDPTGVHGVASQPEGKTWRLYRDATRTKFRLYDVAAAKDVWVGGAKDQTLRLYHAGTVVHLVTRTWDSAAAAYKTYLDRRLRWDYTRFDYDGDWFDAVQVIQNNTFGTGMQKYLWGIAEMPTLFPPEALKAQSVAARTYAARLGGGSVAKPLMPTPADQNYTGYAKESEDASYGFRWKNAVTGTDGQVLKDGSGAYVVTYYSSSMGGYTEDVRYVGWSDTAIPYLSAVNDSRWDMASNNPSKYRSWAVGKSWAQVASKLGFSEISSITVAPRGTTARLDGVKVTGLKNGALVTSYISGWTVRQALGLLSPGFTISMTTIGGRTAQPITGDWDGDGDMDPGWFKDGSVALSMDGKWIHRFGYGAKGDVAVVGDWDGDGDDDIGVFRNGYWYLKNGLIGGAADKSFKYGTTGDLPIVGRWDGSSVGIGVDRKGTWMLRYTASGGSSQARFSYGRSTDLPVVGDWDKDGRTTIGVFRAGSWYLKDRLAGGAADLSFAYGTSTDRPVTGDWNGDLRTTVGVVRGSTWYLNDSISGGTATRVIGFAG